VLSAGQAENVAVSIVKPRGGHRWMVSMRSPCPIASSAPSPETDPAEHCVGAVHVRLWGVGNEKLTAARVGAKSIHQSTAGPRGTGRPRPSAAPRQGAAPPRRGGTAPPRQRQREGPRGAPGPESV
jgi:hypothetical protein